jgi:thiosulfate reductase cytochrome b subunit
MKEATKRSIFRWIHIVLAIPILGYIYSPFEQIPNYAPATRFVFVPILVLSGLLMWKGHVVRRLISKSAVQPMAFPDYGSIRGHKPR